MNKAELDLITVIARLRQIRREGYDNGHWLLDRVVECDLPRLEEQCTPEMWYAVIREEN